MVGTEDMEVEQQQQPAPSDGESDEQDHDHCIEERKKKLLATFEGESISKSNDLKEQFESILEKTSHYADAMYLGVSSPKKKSTKSASIRRQRVSEKEEDEELIEHDKLETSFNEIYLSSTPSYIHGGTMRDYQLYGVNWLVRLHDNGINGILADEMGLGKTLQTICLLGYLKHFRQNKGPHLVISPKSTIANWVNEFRRWCPSFQVVKFLGSKDQRAEIIANELQKDRFEICVTSYEVAIIEKAALKKFHWGYIVIDEAHRIKNEESVLSKVVRMHKSDHRLLLTGTPLQNNLHELWALLNFLLPEVFGSSQAFDTYFDLENTDDKTQVIRKLHKVLRPFLLRRLKSEVETSLPPKKEIKLFVGMTALQREWYKRILLKDTSALNTASGSKTQLLNIAMQLRKCCNHPYLFNGAEPGPPFTNGPHIYENTGKMFLLHKLLVKLKAAGSRVLIFCQMTRMLDILEDYMLLVGYDYCRIDGSTDGDLRETQISDFNAEGSTKFVFMLSTRAGGLGINLATADIVILYDSDWNPQVDLQAQDRAHRIGQKKQVIVYRFVSEGSIEEKIVERAEAKLCLDALVIQQGRLIEQQALGKNELLSMIRFGADQIINSKDFDLTDENIDEILQRGAQRTEELNKRLAEKFGDQMERFSLNPQGNLYEFEGLNYADLAAADKGSVLSGWIEPPKRERKQNYSIDKYYREALRVTEPKKPSVPRPPKQPIIYDFQFFPEKLHHLLKRETAAWRAKRDEIFGKKQEKEKKDSGDESDQDGKEEQEEEDARELTPEEEEEKEKLLKKGFMDWNRRDYQAFIRGCERFGRDNFEGIKTELPEKTIEDIQAYAAVFWKRYQEIPGWEKFLATIEKGEARIKKREDMVNAVAIKVARYKDPLSQLTIAYGGAKGKTFSPEEDSFMVYCLHHIGYGAWEEITNEIRKAKRFRFDWFIKSRTPAEIQRRCEQLIRLIEKENQEIREKEIEAEKKRKEAAKKRQALAKKKAGEKRKAGPAAKASPAKKRTPQKGKGASTPSTPKAAAGKKAGKGTPKATPKKPGTPKSAQGSKATPGRSMPSRSTPSKVTPAKLTPANAKTTPAKATPAKAAKPTPAKATPKDSSAKQGAAKVPDAKGKDGSKDGSRGNSNENKERKAEAAGSASNGNKGSASTANSASKKRSSSAASRPPATPLRQPAKRKAKESATTASASAPPAKKTRTRA